MNPGNNQGQKAGEVDSLVLDEKHARASSVVKEEGLCWHRLFGHNPYQD